MTDTATSSSDLLRGEVALVTGASSGLGERFARVLAAAGAKVVVAARRLDRLERLVAEIRQAGGVAEAVQLDVADAEAIPAAVEAAEAALGPISILVNNAGVSGLQPAVSHDLADIDRMYATNVRGPFLLAREVARRMIDTGRPGRIVNISSVSAYHFNGATPAAFYSMTKSAVLRMTEVLALEWARHNVNVNAIAPGFFHSEMSDANLDAAKEAAIKQRMPRGRIGEPHQLDSTLLYLTSPASEFITGICILADDAQTPR